jgi:hypothetical protein
MLFQLAMLLFLLAAVRKPVELLAWGIPRIGCPLRQRAGFEGGSGGGRRNRKATFFFCREWCVVVCDCAEAREARRGRAGGELVIELQLPLQITTILPHTRCCWFANNTQRW